MKTFNNTNLAYFFNEIYLIVKSNIKLDAGIEILYENEKDEDMKSIEKNIFEDLTSGVSFSKALENVNFPQYCVGMVKLGEKTGKLEEACISIHNYYKNQEDLEHSISNIILIPTALLFASIALLFLMSTEILPVFENVFAQMGIQLSGVARFLIRAGEYRKIILITLLVLTIVGELLCMNHTRFLKFWNAKGSIAKQEFANFMLSLSMYIENGLSYEEAIDLCEKSQVKSVNKKLDLAKKIFKEKGSLSDALFEAGLINSKEKSLLEIASQTGNVPDILNTIADGKQKEALAGVNKVLNIFEIAVLFIISACMGIVLMSVMLPLLGVLGSW